ncbi:PaaX family transcriptional regulator [Labedaea rhizosphaerae]|uniref:PaaX family transcriptional regulator n=2 Tax=Labedaea rhizosphaerae TaxID=598644 RepID=A0A4R6SGZ2_LABRH|nr:PaaX family transcriptional regulator [Labedaea rhizosphaerae]
MEDIPPQDISPQDLAMTLLGAYVPDREQALVWAGGLVALLTEFGCTQNAARVALSRMVQRDLLERERDGRLVRYRLTKRTRDALAEGDRRIFRFGEQPESVDCWTVLWHAIPDERRDARRRLAVRLRFLGFGSVQDGLWLAARDREAEVAALLAELRVERHAGLLTGKPSRIVDVRAAVARAWDLDELAERYRRFVHTYRGVEPAVLDPAAAFGIRTRMTHEFRQYPLLDPELPARLVPPPAARADAVAVFHELYPALAPAAQRYFDEVITP